MLFWSNINGFKWEGSIYSGCPKGDLLHRLPVFFHKLLEILLWRFKQQTLTGAQRIFLRSKSIVGWHLSGWFRRERGPVWDGCEVLCEATQEGNIKNTHTFKQTYAWKTGSEARQVAFTHMNSIRNLLTSEKRTSASSEHVSTRLH